MVARKLILRLYVWAPAFDDRGTGAHIDAAWTAILGTVHRGVLWVAPLGSPPPWPDELDGEGPWAECSAPSPLWVEVGPVGALSNDHELGRIEEAYRRAVAWAQ